jgi:hypothetical protein
LRLEGNWVAPQGDLDLDPDMLTHGICPDCTASLPAPAPGS